MLCFVVVMQSFIMNSHEVFIHIHQGCFAGTGAIVRLPQCQWSKPDGYGKISQCITTTKHSKAITVCVFLGIYCIHAYSGVPGKATYLCMLLLFRKSHLTRNDNEKTLLPSNMNLKYLSIGKSTKMSCHMRKHHMAKRAWSHNFYAPISFT